MRAVDAPLDGSRKRDAKRLVGKGEKQTLNLEL
jgi:hypothetical protein